MNRSTITRVLAVEILIFISWKPRHNCILHGAMDQYSNVLHFIVERSSSRAAGVAYFVVLATCVSLHAHRHRRASEFKHSEVNSCDEWLEDPETLSKVDGLPVSWIKIYYLDGSHLSISVNANTTIKQICVQICLELKLGLYEVEQELSPLNDQKLLPANMTVGELIARWKAMRWPDAKIVAPVYLKDWAYKLSSRALRHVRFENSYLTHAQAVPHNGAAQPGSMARRSNGKHASPVSNNASPVTPALRARERTHALLNSLFTNQEDADPRNLSVTVVDRRWEDSLRRSGTTTTPSNGSTSSSVSSSRRVSLSPASPASTVSGAVTPSVPSSVISTAPSTPEHPPTRTTPVATPQRAQQALPAARGTPPVAAPVHALIPGSAQSTPHRNSHAPGQPHSTGLRATPIKTPTTSPAPHPPSNRTTPTTAPATVAASSAASTPQQASTPQPPRSAVRQSPAAPTAVPVTIAPRAVSASPSNGHNNDSMNSYTASVIISESSPSTQRAETPEKIRPRTTVVKLLSEIARSRSPSPNHTASAALHNAQPLQHAHGVNPGSGTASPVAFAASPAVATASSPVTVVNGAQHRLSGTATTPTADPIRAQHEATLSNSASEAHFSSMSGRDTPDTTSSTVSTVTYQGSAAVSPNASTASLSRMVANSPPVTRLLASPEDMAIHTAHARTNALLNKLFSGIPALVQEKNTEGATPDKPAETCTLAPLAAMAVPTNSVTPQKSPDRSDHEVSAVLQCFVVTRIQHYLTPVWSFMINASILFILPQETPLDDTPTSAPRHSRHSSGTLTVSRSTSPSGTVSTAGSLNSTGGLRRSRRHTPRTPTDRPGFDTSTSNPTLSMLLALGNQKNSDGTWVQPRIVLEKKPVTPSSGRRTPVVSKPRAFTFIAPAVPTGGDGGAFIETPLKEAVSLQSEQEQHQLPPLQHEHGSGSTPQGEMHAQPQEQKQQEDQALEAQEDTASVSSHATAEKDNGEPNDDVRALRVRLFSRRGSTGSVRDSANTASVNNSAAATAASSSSAAKTQRRGSTLSSPALTSAPRTQPRAGTAADTLSHASLQSHRSPRALPAGSHAASPRPLKLRQNTANGTAEKSLARKRSASPGAASTTSGESSVRHLSPFQLEARPPQNPRAAFGSTVRPNSEAVAVGAGANGARDRESLARSTSPHSTVSASSGTHSVHSNKSGVVRRDSARNWVP
jgi:hypothetical protein